MPRSFGAVVVELAPDGRTITARASAAKDVKVRATSEADAADRLVRATRSAEGELSRAAADPIFQQAYARACELAGDAVRAGEAYAEAAYLNGRAEQALMQLQTLKRRDDQDNVARARIDARIAAITPTVLELQRQGVRDPDIKSP